MRKRGGSVAHMNVRHRPVDARSLDRAAEGFVRSYCNCSCPGRRCRHRRVLFGAGQVHPHIVFAAGLSLADTAPG